MQRRNFLGLLAGAAAALALPEVPSTRSYFFGPWKPSDGGLVTKVESWGPVRPEDLVQETRTDFLLDGIEYKLVPRSAVATFIPEIWNAEILDAVQCKSALSDLTARHRFNVQELVDEVAFIANGEFVALAVDDIVRVQSDERLRGQYTLKVAYAFDRAFGDTIRVPRYADVKPERAA